MNPNSMVILLMVILGGVPLSILLYYCVRLALRLPGSPALQRVPVAGRLVAADRESIPHALAAEWIGAADLGTAVVRVRPKEERGLPYASRSA